MRTLTQPITRRASIALPAATRLHAASVTAACAASGPVGRSWAYGGLEKPTTVSQPISASSGAARGSATADVTATRTAMATSTPVAENRPCRAAAMVPMSSMPAKAAGSATCAPTACWGVAWLISGPVNPGSERRSAILTPS